MAAHPVAGPAQETPLGPGDLELEAVSETLFLTIYALAMASEGPYPPLVDPGAVALVRRLDPVLARSDKRVYRRLVARRLPRTLVRTVALRIRRFDRYVADFLAAHPGAVVVNLGCGLDDRRRRVDDGQVRWLDLDLPPVIHLRRHLLPETDRMRFVAASVLDDAWLDEVPAADPEDVLFVAEGLLMYLDADAVRDLVVRLRSRFPGAELVAEVANARLVRMMAGRLYRGKFRRQFGLSEDVVYHFGLEASDAMARWAPGIRLLDDWDYFDDPDGRLGWLRLFAGWSLFRRAQWTVHYRLGGAGTPGPAGVS